LCFVQPSPGHHTTEWKVSPVVTWWVVTFCKLNKDNSTYQAFFIFFNVGPMAIKTRLEVSLVTAFAYFRKCHVLYRADYVQFEENSLLSYQFYEVLHEDHFCIKLFLIWKCLFGNTSGPKNGQGLWFANS